MVDEVQAGQMVAVVEKMFFSGDSRENWMNSDLRRQLLCLATKANVGEFELTNALRRAWGFPPNGDIYERMATREQCDELKNLLRAVEEWRFALCELAGRPV